MTVMHLYPLPQRHSPLQGFYLGLNLHRQAAADDMVMYANYITSLDGRISIRNIHGDYEVPAAIANPRDWRLYQELAAQSDIMLTSARYFRQLAEGKAQDLLPVGDGYVDLKVWRQEQGLPAQPDVAVVSASLDIPKQALDNIRDRKVLVFTHQQAEDSKVQALERDGMTVLVAGDGRVDGQALKRHLLAHGYRSAYMIAGPAVFGTLVQAGVLNHLFLTTNYTLLGGPFFHTLLDSSIDGCKSLQLLSLAIDMEEGQSFAQYAWPAVCD